MLPYTSTQFVTRSLTVTDGQCCYCGQQTEHDRDGYEYACRRCFNLVHEAFRLEHSHMFQHPEGYARATGERNAWPTSVLMSPAFVGGEHVGWYCPGGHGQGSCGWVPTHAEVAEIFAAFTGR